MGISTDANGWTIITPSGSWRDGFNNSAPSASTTMAIFVSSSIGKDSGDGGFNAAIQGSRAQPYRTIASGKAQLRAGSPDWLLLANGDTFTNESFGNMPTGLNSTERMVVASWDLSDTTSNPPIPNPGTGAANPTTGWVMPLILVDNRTNGFGTGFPNNIAVMGLDLYSYTRDPNNPSYNPDTDPANETCGFFATGNSQLVEDCNFRFFHTGGEYGSNVGESETIRRCRITDNHNLDTVLSSGISCAGGVGGNFSVLLEQNLFDINGWNPTTDPSGSSLSHNMYLNANNNLLGSFDHSTNFFYFMEVNGNIVGRGPPTSSEKYPCGGHVHNNFYLIYGTAGAIYGTSNPSANNLIENEVAQDVAGRCDSFITFSGSVIDDHNGHYGYQVPGNVEFTVQNCIIVKPGGPGAEQAMYQAPNSTEPPFIDGNTNDPSDPLVNVHNNIAWKFGFFGTITATTFGGTTVFQLTGYNYFSTTNDHGYLDPNREIGTYMSNVIGSGSTYTDYLAACRGQNKHSWNPLLMAESVNDYIRQGFSVPMIGSAYANTQGGGVAGTNAPGTGNKFGVFKSPPRKIPHA